MKKYVLYTYCNYNTLSSIQTYSTTAQYSTEQYDRTQHDTICFKITCGSERTFSLYVPNLNLRKFESFLFFILEQEIYLTGEIFKRNQEKKK